MEERKVIECVNCGPGLTIESLKDHLIIKDKVALIPGLDDMVEAVIRARLRSRTEIGDELMGRLRSMYSIPISEETDYRSALLDLYDSMLIDFQ